MSRNSVSLPKKIKKSEELKKEGANKSNKLKPKLNTRKCLIYNELNNILDNIHLDPILETFRNNDILKEFFIKRLHELIAVILFNSRNILIMRRKGISMTFYLKMKN
jgi:hypothetical protein